MPTWAALVKPSESQSKTKTKQKDTQVGCGLGGKWKGGRHIRKIRENRKMDVIRMDYVCVQNCHGIN